MPVEKYQPIIETVDAVIAINTALSAALNVSGATVIGIAMPAAWTAANLTFQASVDGSTYNDVYDDAGAEYTVTAAAARYIILDPADFAGFRFLKIRSGTTGTPVNQVAARTLVLNARPV